jgi:hypothetical protein
MPLIRHSNSVSSQNIYTSYVTVASHSLEYQGHAGVWVLLSNLSAYSAMFSLIVEIWDDSSHKLGEHLIQVPKHNSAATHVRLQLDRTLFLREYDQVVVKVKSDNDEDTGVTATAYIFDPNSVHEVLTPVKISNGTAEGQLLTGDGHVLISVGTSPGQLDTSLGRVKVADLYHADINVAVDGVVPQDEYTATWFKNGARLTSGISSPTIQVVKRVDGEPLVPSASMSPIGSTGTYKKDEGTNLISAGEAVLVIVSATIDSATRTFSKVVSRDAAAA